MHVVLDSKDLFTYLSNKRKNIDQSIRVEENVISFDFARRQVVRIVWVPGQLNLADP